MLPQKVLGNSFDAACALSYEMPGSFAAPWGSITEDIFYCKRTILFLSSSKILTPHPPLRPASVYPRLCCGERTDSPGGEGMGGQYFGRLEKQDCPLTVKYVLCGLHRHAKDRLVTDSEPTIDADSRSFLYPHDAFARHCLFLYIASSMLL
jgi:hypothetical protein